MIDKIDKPLTKLTKKKERERERRQITDIRNEKRDIITDHDSIPTNLIS